MRSAFIAAVAVLTASGPACAQPAAPDGRGATVAQSAREARPVARLIVGLRAAEAGSARMRALANRTGVGVRPGRTIGRSMQVVELDEPLTGTTLADAMARLASDAAVRFVEPDGRVYRHEVAGDELFHHQWYLLDAEVAALDATGAWDVTTGAPGTVIAVLDTGVRFDHPDLGQAGRPEAPGRLLPGYDFVGADPGGGFRMANDGDGWDPNPADPGDWISRSDAQLSLFFGCDVGPSSWHGTRIAGMIGAITNNAIGIAGATWGTWILPVRVLGKCFGNNSDILQAMRWAAGLPVDGVPPNPYPAKILNMSLGAAGPCTAGYSATLAELAAHGVLVVASAGNGAGAPVDHPANCQGVAAVTGLRHVGTKVGFSSIGPEVALAAPGGNCVNVGAGAPCLYSLDTTSDRGSTAPAGPAYTDQLDFNVGTSFAAPQVAALAALMQSVNGNLRAPQLIRRLQEAARPFPGPTPEVPTCRVPLGDRDVQLECACTTSTCGAGMADARASVAAALRPIAAVAVPSAVAPGQDVSLDGSGSAAACGREIATYAWEVTSGSAALVSPDAAVTTVVAPASGSFTVRLTVTDEAGAQDSADVVVFATAATTSAPASAGSAACLAAIVPADPGPFVDDGPVATVSTGGGGGGGGGGGALGAAGLCVLAAALAARRRRKAATAA